MIKINLNSEENNSTLPPSFLIQQMEWEEHLESISEQKSELEKFQLLIDGEYQKNLNSLESVCDKDKNWDIAMEMLNEIQFIDKLNSRIIQQINLVESK